MVRFATLALVLVLMAIIAGCDEPVHFNAIIEPAQGYVPYEARIVCTSLAGTYSYELPSGKTITSSANVLDVTVDRLDWTARVGWSDGEQARTDVVSAQGTNPLPEVHRPRISGDAFRWFLRPRERTLIDFTHYPAGLSGPETGVAYDGAWRVVSIEVDCELKSLCGAPITDSVFCPPYEAGRYHALFGSQVVENACVVYPVYTSETSDDERPYPPAPEPGYPFDAFRGHDLFALMAQQNAILHRVGFPAQTAVIRAVVEDDWGRLTTASFDIPVEELAYETVLVPGSHCKDRFFVAERTSHAYHVVTSDISDPYRLSTCTSACAIPASERVFFCRESDAVASGRELCPLCSSLH